MANDIAFTITRGKYKGRVCHVHQMCNNWITATFADTGEHVADGQPISPSITHFEPSEIHKVLKLEQDGQLGSMFDELWDASYNLSHFKKTGNFIRGI